MRLRIPYHSRTGRRIRLMLATLGAALLVAACGSSSSSSSSSSGGSASATSQTTQASSGSSGSGGLGLTAPTTLDSLFALNPTPQQEQTAVAAGKADAAKEGAPVSVPTGKTIAYIALSGQTDSSKRQFASLKTVASLFGFHVIYCDPAFVPARIAQCATSIAAQNPDLVISAADESGLLGAGLRDLHSKGIPWVNISGPVEPTPLLVQYTPNYFTLTHVYDQWLFGQVDQRKLPKRLLGIGATSVGLAARQAQQQFEADTKQAGFTVPVDHQLNLANSSQDTLTTTKSAAQTANIGGMWTACDFCIPLMAQATTTAGKVGAQRPVVGGEFATLQAVDNIRSGTVDGVVDVPDEVETWVALDQALEYWARHKPMAKDASVFSDYSLPLETPYMITKANAGSSGPGPILGPDFPAYFVAKWNAEFKK